jgi:general secretion pathway protein M
MSLRERIDQLDERERRLLGVLIFVFCGLFALSVPLGLTAYLSSLRDDNEALREVLTEIQESGALLSQRAAERAAVDKRYATSAPALAAFLAGLASEVDVSIPETQDQASVPHGKGFEERSTKITMRDVGMLKLARFMEKVRQSNYPVAITKLSIRKRGTKADQNSVQMVVSAFDRKQEPNKQPEGEDESDSEADGEGEAG